MNNGFTISTPEGIEMWQMLRERAALRLEIKGLKNSRGSVYAHIKRKYNLKGNKQKVLDQFTDLINQKKEGSEMK
jgi:hypothetical protein